MFNLTIISTVIYVIAALEIILGFFVFFNDKSNKINRLFCMVSLVTACWLISNQLITLQPNTFWVKNSYATGILLAPVILVWIRYFVTRESMNGLMTTFLFVTTIILYFLTLFTNLILQSVEVSYPGGFNGVFGILFPIYALHFTIVSVYILYIVTNAFRNSSGIEKIQLGYIAIGLYGFWIVVCTVNFILPFFGITFLIPLDSPSSIIFIAAMSQAILKHHLFNIKVIAVQMVTFGLWIFILIRTILAETLRDLAIQGGLLLITVIFGIILIRSVLHEVKQREQIEKLASDIKVAYAKVKDTNEHLEEKIAEQTADVRRAYEIEKKARTELEELNKTKDQFITSTQHHLRTPLTSLKWGLESIRNGDGGPVSAELKKILDTTSSSADEMAEIVENFIKVTERKS